MAFYHTRKTAPKIALGEFYVGDTGTAGHVTRVARPAQSAVGLVIWFEDGSGNKIKGRVGFANESVSLSNASPGDNGLAWHPADIREYELPSWAQWVYVACPTANAKAFGAWHTD